MPYCWSYTDYTIHKPCTLGECCLRFDEWKYIAIILPMKTWKYFNDADLPKQNPQNLKIRRFWSHNCSYKYNNNCTTKRLGMRLLYPVTNSTLSRTIHRVDFLIGTVPTPANTSNGTVKTFQSGGSQGISSNCWSSSVETKQSEKTFSRTHNKYRSYPYSWGPAL